MKKDNVKLTKPPLSSLKSTMDPQSTVQKRPASSVGQTKPPPSKESPRRQPSSASPQVEHDRKAAAKDKAAVDDNIEQRVGARGIKASMDSVEFYGSLTGKQLKAKITQKISNQLEDQKAMAAELAMQKQMKFMALFAAFMWAMAKSEKMDDWREAWREEAEKQAHQGEAAQSIPPADAKKASKASAETLQALQGSMKTVRDKAAKVKERYDKLESNLEEADKFSDEMATKEKPEAIEALQERIDTLEKGAEADAQDISRLQKAGNHEEAMAKMDDLNGKNVQLRSLKDTLAVTKGEKSFYDKEGNVVSSAKSADFVVSNDKKLVKEGNELYLLPKNEALTDANRETARHDFKSNQSDISSARTLIASSRGTEMRGLDNEASQINQQIQQLQMPNQSVTGAPALRATSMEPLPDSPGIEKAPQYRDVPSTKP